MKKLFAFLLSTSALSIILCNSVFAYAPATGDKGMSSVIPFVVIAVVLVILFVVLTVIQKSRKK